MKLVAQRQLAKNKHFSIHNIVEQGYVQMFAQKNFFLVITLLRIVERTIVH